MSSEKMESSKDEKVSEDELSDKDLAKATGGGNTITNVMKMNTENSNNITPNSKAS